MHLVDARTSNVEPSLQSKATLRPTAPFEGSLAAYTLLRQPVERGTGACRRSIDSVVVHRRKTMRTYEVMTIHRPELDENDFQSRVDGVVTYLTDRGATVTGKDIWGKRRFAYEINHMNEGYYSVVTFSASPEAIAELDRMLSLTDEVIRHKIVRPGE
jgi:small subunit ribosomal protein S6